MRIVKYFPKNPLSVGLLVWLICMCACFKKNSFRCYLYIYLFLLGMPCAYNFSNLNIEAGELCCLMRSYLPKQTKMDQIKDCVHSLYMCVYDMSYVYMIYLYMCVYKYDLSIAFYLSVFSFNFPS